MEPIPETPDPTLCPVCPICKYDRSGDGSHHCPECGSKEHPIASSRRLMGTWYIVPALYLCTAIWVPLYFIMLRATYRYGVWQDENDKTWRVGVAAAVGILAAGSFLAWRRRNQVVLLPLALGVILLVILALAIALGVVVLIAALQPQPRY